MVRCGFLFDLIVVRVDVPIVQIEDNKLISVDASFNNINLHITSSRINVVEFKPKRSFEFESSPEDLRRDLSICPLKLKVYYDSRIIGVAIIPWNTCVLDRIDKNMGEVTHIDECELTAENGQERVGALEYICRLQCKCEEPSDEFCTNVGGYDLKKHINKIIDPNDILFVVAEPNKEDVCNVPLNGDDDSVCDVSKPTTALDLSPYRILNGRLVQNSEAVDTCQSTCRKGADPCELMRTSNQYQKLIDALNPCKNSKSCSSRKCQAYAHCDECPHREKMSCHSDTSSECSVGPCICRNMPCNCFASEHHCDNVFGGRKLPKVNVCSPMNCVPDEQAYDFVGPRNCPVCKEDLRWLPKLGTCPKCGYKPVPVFVEKPHNENLTAEEVLQEYYNERTTGGSENDGPRRGCERSTECRCTCTKGKTCANCRVRQMCGDILQPFPNIEDECGKCDEESDELYKLCTTSSKDCRPHLTRVFSELKDLFDAPTPRSEPIVYNEKCERELNPPRRTSGQMRRSTQSAAQARQSSQLAAQTRRSSQYAAQPRRLSQRLMSQTISGSRGSKAQPCRCDEIKRKRKRLRKRRGHGRRRFGSARAITKPSASHDTTVYSREDRMAKYHDDCLSHRKNVPSNMGWLWNANPELGSRWRPGAIRKPIKEIMRYFLRDFPADTIPVSKYHYRRGGGHTGKGDERNEEEENLIQLPTLQICKKNGEIYITLRPLKNPEALKHCANPYLNMKPIQFKIVKNPLASEISKMKRCLKDMGFNKCTCHQPLVECFCRTFLDKKRLEYQIKKECRKRNLDSNFCESLILSDTSDSEVEYDFGVTPPAGLIKPDRAKKPDKVNVGTQYEQCDWNPPPLIPAPPNTYMKWINCATGHKYAHRRASDLLTIGQKEAIACKKAKMEEAALKKKLGKKGRKALEAARAALEAAMPKEKVDTTLKTCPDGTKVDMRKYMDPKSGPAGQLKKK